MVRRGMAFRAVACCCPEGEEREQRVGQFGHDLHCVLKHEGVDGEQPYSQQGLETRLALRAG